MTFLSRRLSFNALPQHPIEHKPPTVPLGPRRRMADLTSRTVGDVRIASDRDAMRVRWCCSDGTPSTPSRRLFAFLRTVIQDVPWQRAASRRLPPMRRSQIWTPSSATADYIARYEREVVAVVAHQEDYRQRVTSATLPSRQLRLLISSSSRTKIEAGWSFAMSSRWTAAASDHDDRIAQLLEWIPTAREQAASICVRRRGAHFRLNPPVQRTSTFHSKLSDSCVR